jgi:hypothetical protein
MLDDLGTLHARDPHGFLARLSSLPDAYAGPDGARPGPYGFDATGPAAVLVPLLAPWVDGRLTARGTQFLVDGGFDVEAEFAAQRAAAELAGADVVVLGAIQEAESVGTEPDVALADDALTPYHLVRYLAFATGRSDAGERLAEALRQVAKVADPMLPTAENPAKRLAWALWQRVPLLVTERGAAAAQPLVQQSFARVGKALAVPTGHHGALVAAVAFEGRHALGDDLVALVLGRRLAETDLVEEVLATRVAQVERMAFGADWLPPATEDAVIDGITLWYAATWVAAYGALLADLDPAHEGVYGRVRAVA